LTTCSIYSQFDASAFVTSVRGALGTGGRNADHASGQRAGEVSMWKNFKIREVATVQFRTETFIPTASPHDSPRFQNDNASAPNFGSLVSVGGNDVDIFSSRVFQLALKLVC
jgi:hypothetical protein